MAAVNAEEQGVLEKNALNYFMQTNYLNRCIVTEEKTLIKYLGDHWNALPRDRQDKLLDLLLVDDDVRRKYDDSQNDGTLSRTRAPSDSESDQIQESFPRLFVSSGQKINVDFENDLWTWRDEHSGPFSWMSRSQQDLTLADLEPDNISKPQPKLPKADAEDEGNVKIAESQFTYPSSSWFHDIIDDFKKHEQDVVITPSTSMNLTTSARKSSLEEINPAFEGSTDDLSRESTPAHENDTKSTKDEKEINSNSDKKQKGKDRGRRSPSPKKILRAGSFKKSPADQGGQKLISEDDHDGGDGVNVFSNPVMDSEWSTFVGDQPAETNTHSVTSAPEMMTMDRGVGMARNAPYQGDHMARNSPYQGDHMARNSPYQGDHMARNSPYQGDQVHLLASADSHVKATTAAVAHASPRSEYSSVESTPDHRTHLLKGMQTPDYQISSEESSRPLQNTAVSESSTDSGAVGIYKEDIPAELETEEVLIVDGDKIVMIPQTENPRDSSIPTTGFDFLDNW